MAKLTKENILAITDNIGLQIKKLIDLIGDTETTDTLKKIAFSNLTRIKNFADTEKMVYILDSAYELVNKLDWSYLALVYRPFIIDLHLNLEKSLSDYFIENNYYKEDRINPYYALLCSYVGIPLNPKVTFPPITILAEYDCSPPTFTKKDKVNTALFGGGKIEAEALETTDAEIIAYGINEDGAEDKWQGTLSGGAGTKADLTNTSGTRCVEITNIAVNSGATGAFRIQTKFERTLTE
jgi:hypothetical protein